MASTIRSKASPQAVSLPAWRRLADSPWLPAAGLVLLAAIVYWPTLSNGFVSDDQGYVIGNTALRSARGLWNIWFKIGTVEQYYPLVFTTFWIEYHLWGLEPLGYHVVNLIAHSAGCILLWRLLVRLEVPGAWLAAAIFAVHPVEVESVAWVSERKNVLSAALAFGSMLAYLRFSPAQSFPDQAPLSFRVRAFYYATALALYVAALLAKTVAASMPAVLLVIYWWKRGRVGWRDAARLAPFFTVGLSLSVLTVWMEKAYVGAKGETWDYSAVDRLLIAGRAAWFYAGKLAWPHPLNFFYPRWTIDSHQGWQYTFPLAAVVLLAALWLARGRIGRGPLAAALVFGGVLVPALGFFDVYPFRFALVADHYQYHASAALIALAAAALATVAARFSIRGPRAVVATGVLLAPLLVVAHQRTHVYRDDLALNEDVLANNPQSWVANNNIGGCLIADGKFEEAIPYLREAIRLLPSEGMHYCNLAWTLSRLKRYDEAAIEFDRALACDNVDNERAWIYKMRGLVQLEQSEPKAAADSFDKSIALYSGALEPYLQRGRARALLGDTNGAMRDATEALKLDPTNIQALELRAQLNSDSGNYDRALEDFESLRAAMPANPQLVLRIAAICQATRQWRRAVDAFTQALKLDSANPTARRGRADALLNLGRQSEALADYQAVLEIEPENVEVLNNMAWLMATSPNRRLRDGPRAIRLALAAAKASEYKRTDVLGTLAASYAEGGDFGQAQSWTRHALELAPEALKAELGRQLQSYQAGKPWREATPTPSD